MSLRGHQRTQEIPFSSPNVRVSVTEGGPRREWMSEGIEPPCHKPEGQCLTHLTPEAAEFRSLITDDHEHHPTWELRKPYVLISRSFSPTKVLISQVKHHTVPCWSRPPWEENKALTCKNGSSCTGESKEHQHSHRVLGVRAIFSI